MSRERKTLSMLQYLLDEGFISFGFSEGEPTIFLTSLSEAQKALESRLSKDSADWWKE